MARWAPPNASPWAIVCIQYTRRSVGGRLQFPSAERRVYVTSTLPGLKQAPCDCSSPGPRRHGMLWRRLKPANLLLLVAVWHLIHTTNR